jgi:hypothetical protein
VIYGLKFSAFSRGPDIDPSPQNWPKDSNLRIRIRGFDPAIREREKERVRERERERGGRERKKSNRGRKRARLTGAGTSGLGVHPKGRNRKGEETNRDSFFHSSATFARNFSDRRKKKERIKGR